MNLLPGPGHPKGFGTGAGDRRIALVRELTKLHEEKYYGKISSLLEELKGQEVKGEIVIIVEGKQPGEGLETAAWAELEIEEHVRLLMAEGLSKKKPSKGSLKSGLYPKGRSIKRPSVLTLGNS